MKRFSFVVLVVSALAISITIIANLIPAPSIVPANNPTSFESFENNAPIFLLISFLIAIIIEAIRQSQAPDE